MNMNQIINMVMRILMRRAINSGINAGINAAGRMGKRKRGQSAPPPHADFGHAEDYEDHGLPMQEAPPSQGAKPQLSPEERARRHEIRQARRAARQDRG